MKIGQKVRFTPFFTLSKEGKPMDEPKTIVTAKIVYINRPHRYFTARFKLNGHVFYESFKYTEEGDLIGRS